MHTEATQPGAEFLSFFASGVYRMNLTENELNQEWDVVFHTRLGIICGTAAPTEAQIDIATQEADEHIWRLRKCEESTQQR